MAGVADWSLVSAGATTLSKKPPRVGSKSGAE